MDPSHQVEEGSAVAEETIIDAQAKEHVSEKNELADTPTKAKASTAKSVSFSEQDLSDSEVACQEQPRLRGPLVESSIAPADADLLSRPWPKDANTPLHRLIASNTTTSHASSSLGPCSCFSWSRRRIQVAFFGCTSSVIVLVARLLLDKSPSAYVIHSVIVFLDMILIHLFTFCPWLSVSGEMVTILFFLSFHYTNEKVFELLETTLIAALCSMHMIVSRGKHMNHEEKLEESLRQWHQLSLRSNPAGSSLASSVHRSAQERAALVEDDNEDNNQQASALVQANSNGDIESDCLSPPASLHHSQNQLFFLAERDNDESMPPSSFVRTCGAHFFEHFLDGSAGVMYTSFVGLIVDDLINYGTSKCK